MKASTADKPNPDMPMAWHEYINPQSLVTVKTAMVEPALAKAVKGDKFQFTRLGYYNTDDDSRPGNLVFNLTVPLKEAKDKA